MICQYLDLIGANARWIFLQGPDYGICFLLKRQPIHLVWGYLPGTECKRVNIAAGFINLFKDGSNRIPACVKSYIEVLIEFRYM